MVTVIVKDVNTRSAPGAGQPPVGSLDAGASVTVKAIVPGQEIEGNSTWYLLDNGSYIWSGSTERAQLANSLHINPNQWHLIQYNIPQLWQQYGCRGEGINIAIFDTGIQNNYADYFGNNIAAQNIVNFSSTGQWDAIGHGSHCAAIIAAAGIKNNLYGVAPKSTLFVAKTVDDDGTSDRSYFAAAFKRFSAGTKPSIISVSQGFDEDPQNELSKAIAAAIAGNDVLIVAAAGNNNDPSVTTMDYPASIQPVLSVGAVDINFSSQNQTIQAPDIQVYAPGLEMYSLGLASKDFSAFESGTSAATPFVAGVLALGLQLIRSIPATTIKITDLPGILLATCDKLTDAANGKSINIINPAKFLSKLKSN